MVRAVLITLACVIVTVLLVTLMADGSSFRRLFQAVHSASLDLIDS